MNAAMLFMTRCLIGVGMAFLGGKAYCGDKVFLWNLHSPDFGSFKIMIDKERLSKAKKIDLMREEPPLSLGDAARVAMEWVKSVHGDVSGMRVDEVVFISGGDAMGVGFSYYRVNVIIPDFSPSGGGERKTVWERVPVMFDGKVLDRVPIKVKGAKPK